MIPGPVVRDLMDSNEQRIAALERELNLALQEAEEAEGRVAVLSGSPSNGPNAGSGPESAAPGDARRNGPPRTTVVSRPRPRAG